MKQILSILAIALVVLTGCSKDDDKKDLIGTWMLEKVVETPPSATANDNDKECPTEVTFTKDNKFKTVNYEWKEQVKGCVVPEDGITEGTYTLHENKITLTVVVNESGSKESETGEILKLSKNELVIKMVGKNGTGVFYFKRK